MGEIGYRSALEYLFQAFLVEGLEKTTTHFAVDLKNRPSNGARLFLE
jgi:hypothetical protein